MKVAIMQPYIFPYIGYFQLLNAVDVFVVYDDVNYIKKGWINRNTILVNGNGFLFTVPLKNVSQNKHINQISLDDDASWKKELLKTIELSYKKAPYFDDVFPILKKIVLHPDTNLASFIFNSLQQICDYLAIKTTLILSSAIEKNTNLKGQDKIIEICRKLNTTQYVNAIGGKELYTKDAFLDNTIELNFITTNPIVYNQFKNDFIPWLSIIDVLMFNSVEQTKDFLNQYKLL
jgi:hypothetical protein